MIATNELRNPTVSLSTASIWAVISERKDHYHWHCTYAGKQFRFILTDKMISLEHYLLIELI